MKKIISLISCLLVLCLALGTFSACKPNSGNNGYVLTIGYESGGYGTEWIESAVSKFCEKEGIDRKQVYVQAEKGYVNGVMDKLSTSTQVRDILIGCGTQARAWGAMGWLEPLNDVFDQKLSDGTTTVSGALVRENALLPFTQGDSVYGYPTNGAGAYGIHYNKTLFEQKGWSVPSTFDDLMALCKKIYNDEVADVDVASDRIYPFAVSGDIINYWDFLVQNWIIQLMGEENYKEYCKFEKEGSRNNFGVDSEYSKAKIAALDAWTELAVENSHYILTNSSDYMATEMMFVQGKVAMMPNADWFECEVSASLPEEMEIAIMPTPYLEGAKKNLSGDYIKYNYAGEGGNGWMIPSAAKNKEMAKKFLIFMAEPEMVKDRFLKSGTYSAFKCDYSAFVNEMSSCQRSVYEMITGATPVFFETTSDLKLANLATFWIGNQGMPYGPIFYSKDEDGRITKNATKYVSEVATYLSSEWDNMWKLI